MQQRIVARPVQVASVEFGQQGFGPVQQGLQFRILDISHQPVAEFLSFGHSHIMRFLNPKPPRASLS